MTMHIVFQRDKDGYKVGQSCYVERSLARRFCENGIAITYQKHLDDLYDAEQRKIEVEAAEAEKEKADQAKKEKADQAKKEKADQAKKEKAKTTAVKELKKTVMQKKS